MDTDKPAAMGISDAFLSNFDRDQDKKRLYLSYRLCGFGRDEDMECAGILHRILYHWGQKDSRFDEIGMWTWRELFRRVAQKEELLHSGALAGC